MEMKMTVINVFPDPLPMVYIFRSVVALRDIVLMLVTPITETNF